MLCRGGSSDPPTINLQTRPPLIRQAFLYSERGVGQALRDAHARLAIAVEQVALRLAACDVRGDRVHDGASVVTDVGDVVSALAPRLAGADVHRWHAEIRA